ncbi:hypothetical protein BBJ29_009340 [Phytophthora kernoviae]|uniref:Uncharacterized protein n=1 Tax=Phytophthora kernoviae TaxID=325452 RepID=A0A3F2RBW0_9STRA|nr:hypothetical protein BBP00_00009756 [Phytophthora kernoviae]RLN61955.1 hypothetical protein BBJ29_009340 [Phytophthora kernoviae]
MLSVPLEKIKEKMYMGYNPHYKTLLNEYMNLHIKPAVEKADDVVKDVNGVSKKKVKFDETLNKVYAPVGDIAKLADDAAAAA